jgi:hypothetical protein
MVGRPNVHVLTGVTCCFRRPPKCELPKGDYYRLFGYAFAPVAVSPRAPRYFNADADGELLAEARRADTRPERLVEIAKQPDCVSQAVLDALAENPNTPPSLLKHLFGVAAGAACRNPALPLIPLEEPGFFSDLDAGSCKALLSRADAPDSFLSPLLATARTPDVFTEARMHVGVMGELDDEDCWLEVETLLQHLTRNVTSQESISQCFELVESGLAPEWLTGERDDPLGDRMDATEAFSSPSLHPVLDADDEYEEADGETAALTLLLDCLPADPRLSRMEFTWGYDEFGPEDDDPLEGGRRYFLPGYMPDLYQSPTWFLRRLASSGMPMPQWHLAQHPATPAECLLLLAEGASSSLLRRAVRQHPNANDEVRAACRDSLVRTFAGREGRRLPDVLHLFLLLACHERSPVRLRESQRLTTDERSWLNRVLGTVALPSDDTLALERLATEDGNCLVRAVARARLRGETLTWD